jgi:hypothetical protein
VQLHYSEQDDQWRVVDVSQQNGTYQVGRGRLLHPHPLVSGEEFDLGETRIRIVLADHVIEPARVLPAGRVLADYFAMPVVALGLLVVTLGVFAFGQYLGQGTEIKLQALLLEGLMFLSVPFVWACIWGMIGRVAVHDARFSFHLSMGSLLLMLLFAVAVAGDFLSFGFSSDQVSLWLENVGEGLLLTVFLLASLAMATSMRRKSRWILANSLAWGVVALSVLVYVVNADPYESQGEQAFRLKPPFARLQAPVSLAEFMADAETLFAELDEDEDDAEYGNEDGNEGEAVK